MRIPITEDTNAQLALRVAATGIWQPVSGINSELLRHPLLSAVWHVLQELLVANGTRIVPTMQGQPVPDDEYALHAQLTQADHYALTLRHLTQSHLVGAAVAEILWDANAHPIALRPIPTERVQFGLDAYGQVVNLRVQTDYGLQDLPLERAVYVIAQPLMLYYRVPPRLLALKRYLDAYDRTLRAIDLYLQRHAVPTTIATTPPTITEPEREQIYDALVKMKDAFVAVLPAGDGSTLQFLEPRGSGIEFALEYLQMLERLIARALLGSILAVYEAQYGTRAQAQVHWETLKSVISAMQQPIEDALHDQLWRPYCTEQLGHEPITRFRLNEPERMQSEALMRNIADLVALGFVDPDRDRDWVRALVGLED